MYLKPQIHGTQDTLTIHVGYIGIHRDTYKDTYLEPYLRPSSTWGELQSAGVDPHGPNGWPHRCAAHDDGIKTFPQPPRYVSRMYPACILHGSRMYLDCILIATEDTCIPHVSRMYPSCIPHVAFVSDTSLSGCIWDTCIPHVSRMSPACILMTSEDTCIPHVSRMYLASEIRTSPDTFEIHVSHYVFLMYPACILYVSSNRCRYM